jgi:hypothetical protein
MTAFDYSVPAELFRHKTPARQSSYWRFGTAAEAIGYAVERLDDIHLNVTVLQVDDERLDRFAIRQLYESIAYPLPRKPSP